MKYEYDLEFGPHWHLMIGSQLAISRFTHHFSDVFQRLGVGGAHLQFQHAGPIIQAFNFSVTGLRHGHRHRLEGGEENLLGSVARLIVWWLQSCVD